MPKLLEGIRVLELTAWHAGPAAGYQLGDLGAEVIKIEDPVGGDPQRGMEAMWGTSMTTTSGINIAFETANRSKKSVTLDLKKPAARAVFYELAKKSDVFITNYLETVLGRLGADYATLSALNPRLIYGMLSGYGIEGPDANKVAYDTTSQARSGLMTMLGDGDLEEPSTVTGIIIDQLGGTMLCQAVLGALYYREKTGRGQMVSTSLLGSAVHMQVVSFNTQLWRGSIYKKHTRKRAPNPLSNFYECGDGKWIFLGGHQADRYWEETCRVLGLEFLNTDPRFDSLLKRRHHREEICTAFADAFATKPREAWGRALAEIGLPWEAINTIGDAAEDPQVLANRYVTDFDHPIFGPTKLTGYPIHYGDAPAAVAGKAPEHGEHTEEVLLDVLGYSWEQIGELREQGAI